jgi:hypothetical protein
MPQVSEAYLIDPVTNLLLNVIAFSIAHSNNVHPFSSVNLIENDMSGTICHMPNGKSVRPESPDATAHGSHCRPFKCEFKNCTFRANQKSGLRAHQDSVQCAHFHGLVA